MPPDRHPFARADSSAGVLALLNALRGAPCGKSPCRAPRRALRAAAGAACLLAQILAGPAAAQARFQSDLEKESRACFSDRPASGCGGWMGIHDEAISLVSGKTARSGKQSLRILFTRNEDYGGAWRKTDGRHIRSRFHDYYAAGFDFAAGMKIHRLSSFNERKQKNDFDIILQLKAEEPGADYCGLTEAKHIALSFNGGPVDWGSVEARWTPMRNRWYAIETEVKLNTPGLSDGEVRILIDGATVAEKTGMNLTGKVASPINRVMFGGWYSNASAGRNPCPDPVGPSIRYVDDPGFTASGSGGAPPLEEGPSPAEESPIPDKKPDPPQPRKPRVHNYDPIPD